MTFRTEIGTIPSSFKISHDDRILLLGSCFADNVGSRLVRDGFSATHNPMGPLFNPASIVNVLTRGGRPYSAGDFVERDGIWHCLDFASRYRASSPEDLAQMVNDDYLALWDAFTAATVIIITFGTDKVYEHSGKIAGNCHKLPAAEFSSRFLQLEEIRKLWEWFNLDGGHCIFTLSPVKYPGDGLAQSCLSKSKLRVAIDAICASGNYDYFPAYEIVTEDLRDYRFYAPDMKHPSEVAVDYIYEHFARTYFSKETMAKADAFRKEYLRSQHRPILT
ncbi:MAG: GSCFA domain-containing protein [Muribaculaceae bacterium]|nr:GSCFA domain-containing protein [Muribaculaceae bacterium]